MSGDLALTVKARAMFGKRLKEADYDALMQKRDVGEIAAYLKNQTAFAQVLSGINERAIHRQHLESLLRKDIYIRLQKLLRYSGKDDAAFIASFSMKSEILMILSCVRYIMNPDPEIRDEMIASMPLFSQRYFSFELRHLVEISSYDELIGFLADTPYRAILSRYRCENIEQLDYLSLEHDMELLVFDRIFRNISVYGKGEDGERMRQIISQRAELTNLSIIYRLKKDFVTSSQRIEDLLLPYQMYFSKKQLHEMIENNTAQEILEAIQKKYRSYAKDITFTNIEHFIQQISYNMYHNFIEYETEPTLVLMSYLYLADTEINNIITIIEGVRYKVSPDRIAGLLIY